MKPPSNRTHLFFRTLLVVCCLALPLFADSIAAPGRVQQTPAVTGAQANSQSRDTSSSGALKFPVTVTGARGGFIIGLTKENFSVWEGKTQREINYFSSAELPASVGVLIDVSGSVKPQTLEAAKYAAERFIRQGYEKNEYLVGEFSHSWRSWSGWRQDVPSAIEALNSNGAADADKSQQSKQKPRGQTALYDACVIALDEVGKRPNPRRVLLLITDGQDNSSRLTLDQLRKKIRASDVQIYAVGIAEPYESNVANIVGQMILDELTTASGGRAYFPQNKKDRKELNEVIDRIVIELAHQYVVGFTPANAAPAGKWNKVKIKLTSPDESTKSLLPRTREGYFSPTTTP